MAIWPTEGGGAVLDSNILISYSIDLELIDSSEASDTSEHIRVIKRSRLQVKRQTRKHDDEYLQYSSKSKGNNLEEDEYINAIQSWENSLQKCSKEFRQIKTSTSRLASASPQNGLQWKQPKEKLPRNISQTQFLLSQQTFTRVLFQSTEESLHKLELKMSL